VWATAQGLTTLPLALAGWLLLGAAHVLGPAGTPGARPADPGSAGSIAAGLLGAGFDWPLGPRPTLYVGLMLAIGLLSSWVGTLCWNRASRLLPTSLAGQLIVF